MKCPVAANEVAAVVTVDCVDKLTRYTYWTDEFYRVYETDKLMAGQTAGGRCARYLPDQSGANPYGCLPFAFVWFELPVSGVDSVQGLGPFLSELNGTIDVDMSDMAQAFKAYHNPTGVIYDGDVGWQPVKRIGDWLRVNSVASDLEKSPTPKLEYLQAQLDTAAGQVYIRGVIDSELEALGVPLTSYRMDSATLPSGAALVAEQKPLQDYAVERREPFRLYESELKTVTLKVAGAYYSRRGPDRRGRAATLTHLAGGGDRPARARAGRGRFRQRGGRVREPDHGRSAAVRDEPGSVRCRICSKWPTITPSSRRSWPMR